MTWGSCISIPGAADLVATTVSLFDAKEIALTDVVLDEGSGSLTKLVSHPHRDDPDPTKDEPFFNSADIGKRIMVTGAGPIGGDLVTSVAGFVDKTTLILDEPAEQAVTGRRMVLNAPDRIGLDDYARADAENLIITLPDGRTVTDAEIFKGQAALRSETAKFSVKDLGQAVTLSAAGVHVTTIDAVEDRTTVQLHVAPERPVTGGQADVWDGGSDCRPAFRELLNGLREAPDSVEAADIVFGPGVFDFTNDPDDHVAGSLDLVEVRNVTLRGAGPGATVLRLRPDQDLRSDSHVLHLRRCTNVTIRDLTVHGAYLTMGKVNEQMHGIFLGEGCEDIIIERVTVFQTAGDGLRLLGARDNTVAPPIDRPVRRVWVDKCRLVQNKRSGVAVQRNVERVWIRDCFIEMTRPSTDSCVDFEPSGTPARGDESPARVRVRLERAGEQHDGGGGVDLGVGCRASGAPGAVRQQHLDRRDHRGRRRPRRDHRRQHDRGR